MERFNYLLVKNYILINKIIIYFIILSMSLFFKTDYFPVVEVMFIPVLLYILMFCNMKKFKPILNFINTSFFKWYMLFWTFLMLITVTRNSDQMVELIKTWMIFSIYIIAFGILYGDEETREKIDICSIVEIITIFLSIWIVAFDFKLLLEGERIGFSVTTNNPNGAGTLLSIYIYFIIYKINQVKDKNKVKHILALVLCFAVILATGSKKAIIMSIFSFILFLFEDGHIKLKRVLYFTVIAVVLIVCCFKVPSLYNNIGRRFLSFFGELGIIEFQTDHSSELRMTYVNRAIELWEQNKILGGGYGNFMINSGYHTYCHNNYLELLSSVGIIGTLIYYGYYVVLLKKNILKRDMKYILACLFIIATFFSDFGSVNFYMYPLYYIMLFIININCVEIQKEGEIIYGKQKDN